VLEGEPAARSGSINVIPQRRAAGSYSALQRSANGYGQSPQGFARQQPGL
jgi:hypothetical protein